MVNFPTVSIVKFVKAAVDDKIGEFRVVEASGTMTLEILEGDPVGVQFSMVVHPVPCDPFHVYEDNSDFDKVFSNFPKLVGKFPIPTLAMATQLSV